MFKNFKFYKCDENYVVLESLKRELKKEELEEITQLAEKANWKICTCDGGYPHVIVYNPEEIMLECHSAKDREIEDIPTSCHGSWKLRKHQGIGIYKARKIQFSSDANIEIISLENKIVWDYDKEKKILKYPYEKTPDLLIFAKFSRFDIWGHYLWLKDDPRCKDFKSLESIKNIYKLCSCSSDDITPVLKFIVLHPSVEEALKKYDKNHIPSGGFKKEDAEEILKWYKKKIDIKIAGLPAEFHWDYNDYDFRDAVIVIKSGNMNTIIAPRRFRSYNV